MYREEISSQSEKGKLVMSEIERIWADFYDGVNRFIRNRVADEQIADDLTQDVFVKIHLHAKSLRDVAHIESWIYQIARRTVIDYYRRKQIQDDLPEDVVDLDAWDMGDEDLSYRLKMMIRGMIMGLPDIYRDALILTDFAGLTQQELADKLGLSLSGAKSRVQRGRSLLRELLLDCCHFELDQRGRVVDYQPRCVACAEANASLDGDSWRIAAKTDASEKP